MAVFAYGFPHRKSHVGLVQLFLKKANVAAVLLQPFVPDRLAEPPLSRGWVCHPQDLCRRFGFPYALVSHESTDAVEILKAARARVAIILGARVLPPEVVNSFEVGVVNVHPGCIPLNRGLDCVRWAIVNGWPQGVTAHLLSERIDYGGVICAEEVSVWRTDGLSDLVTRVQMTEEVVMSRAIDWAMSPTPVPTIEQPPGTYHSRYSGSEVELSAALRRYTETRGISSPTTD